MTWPATRRMCAGVAALGLAVLFCAGVADMFALRFGRGDVYPPFSTRRSSRDGCKALFASLSLMPGIAVERLEQHLSSLAEPERTTLFLAGIRSFDGQFCHNTRLQSFLLQGGRAVVVLSPTADTISNMRDWFGDGGSSTNQATNSWFSALTNRMPWLPTGAVRTNSAATSTSLFARVASGSNAWLAGGTGSCACVPAGTNLLHESLSSARDDIEFRVVDWDVSLESQLWQSKDRMAEPDAKLRSSCGVEPVLVRSRLWFKPDTSVWQTLYRDGTRPVIIERAYGSGSLVLASPSWFITNEGLRDHAAPCLIAWLTGARPVLVFDETIHGIVASKNVAWLARKYQLGPFFAMLGVVLAVFLWRVLASVSSVPHSTEEAGDTLATAETSMEGLEDLVRRTVPAPRLLAVCADEWRQTSSHAHSRTRPLPEPGPASTEDEIVAEFNRLCRLMSRSATSS